jgi:hypothetical protein
MKHTRYSREAFKENIVYPCQINKDAIKGYRVYYSYMHGKLQDIVGFDLYCASPEFIMDCLEKKIFLCTVQFKRKKYKAIVFNSFYRNRMKNYVVLLDDLKGIQEAIEKNYKGYYVNENAIIEFLNINYPEIIEIIKSKL